ncbi:MAG: ferrous iron transport protein B [Rickettsiales bacterium]|jgi:ferrous iron transport protein B|nr:ferrous iron transport protein B [Rickettsiales bacterium]
MARIDCVVAIVGNPNTGKTSIFNALTNQNQKVGNWAGVTIEIKSGIIFENENLKLTLVDLPGLYSLRTKSEEETIAARFIRENHLAATIVVLDSSRLERSLYLYSQLAELGQRTLVILNMNDVATAEGISIDDEKLADTLGCPIIRTVANRAVDIEKIKNTLLSEITGKRPTKESSYFRNPLKSTVETIGGILPEKGIRAIEKLRISNTLRFCGGEELWGYPESLESLKNSIAIKLLEGDSDWYYGIIDNGNDIENILAKTNSMLETKYNATLHTMLIEDRWNFAHDIVQKATEKMTRNVTATEKIDKIMLNRALGIPIFLSVMFLMFNFVFKLGKPMVNVTQFLLERTSAGLSNFLKIKNVSPNLLSLLIDGVVNGVGSVVMFFPNIFLLFFFLGFLEDTGYLSRGMFLMDRVMVSIGLQGKSFISLLMGFGCSVPAIMSTRILDQRRDRILTMLLVPFMSCSAKLPIFMLFASVFFPKNPAAIIFLLYIIGILLAAVTAKIMSKTIIISQQSSLMAELPAYHLPRFTNVAKFALRKAMEFLKDASTYIMAGIFIIWGLSSVPFNVEYASEFSFLGIIGNKLKFLFSYTGYNFWQAVVALTFGLIAKEIIISSFATLLSASGDNLSEALQQYFTPLSAFSFMLTILLYSPCLGAIAAFRRETKSWGWTTFMVLYTISLSVITSSLFYQLGKLFI